MKFRTKPCEIEATTMDRQKCKRDYAICKK